MNYKARKLIVVLLALVVPLVAVSGNAQQNNGSPDGLYVLPDADQAARNQRESPSSRAAESYLDSLDPESLRMKGETERAEAVRRATIARKSANGLAARQGLQWLPSSFDLTERVWLAVLTAVGLLISFAAAGYLWWNRSQGSRAPVAVLMPIRARQSRPVGDSKPDKSEESKRRAA